MFTFHGIPRHCDFFFNIFWYLSHSCSLSTTCFPPPHFSSLPCTCLPSLSVLLLFVYFSSLSPLSLPSLLPPFSLNLFFLFKTHFSAWKKKKKKLKSKTVDLPRCFALSYKIPKSTRFFFLFTFQYQRLAQEFSGSKN